ncbi:MAG: nucleotide sugar dehydrogenase [Gemmatimonadales bacterium]
MADGLDQLKARIQSGEATVGIIGLGYVGLPLGVEVARSGMRVLGFDISKPVCDGINAGKSHVEDVPTDLLAGFVAKKLISATTDFARLTECDAISICVPTPLNKTKDPDLSYVVAAAQSIKATLRPGQLIILESTTYPGTTRDVLLPIFESTGLKAGTDFALAFSPERVDPGNPTWQTRNTPKVIGGLTPRCKDVSMLLYGRVFDTMVPVQTPEAAELVKVYENTFRLINIALANELAQVCDKLGLDVWDVIDAAATKPFGFMKFTPGPGLGGHCIPLDPHYLSWKMRTLSFRTRIIEVAAEINAEMPAYVVQKAANALNDRGKALKGCRVLVVGVAYKKNIGDLRESPALDIIRLLEEKGAAVQYSDPHVANIVDDGHTPIHNLPMASQPLTSETLKRTDLAIIVTDHAGVDYAKLLAETPLVLDTRGVYRSAGTENLVGLSGKPV